MEKILASENDAKQYLSTIERKVYFIYAYLELFGKKPHNSCIAWRFDGIITL